MVVAAVVETLLGASLVGCINTNINNAHNNNHDNYANDMISIIEICSDPLSADPTPSSARRSQGESLVIVAIFCPFSQFCEINISLPSLQNQPETAPNLFQRGVEYGKYGGVTCLTLGGAAGLGARKIHNDNDVCTYIYIYIYMNTVYLSVSIFVYT